MGCGASSSVSPGEGVSTAAAKKKPIARQLTSKLERTSKSMRMSSMQREALEEADAHLPEYMRLGVAVEWLRGFAAEKPAKRVASVRK